MSKKMTQITIRGIPPDLFRQIRREAREKGSSVNKLLLGRLVPEKEASRPGEDLLQFSGTWDKARARDFDKQLKGQRRIDPELWP